MTRLPRSPFAARWGIGAWTGARVIVVAETGRTASYDAATGSWAEREPMSAAMDFPFGLWTGDRLLAVGGDADARQIRVAAYDPDVDHWQELPELPFVTRLVDATWTDGSLLVLGSRDVDGEGNWVGDDVLARFDLAGGEWARLERPPIAVASETMAMHLYADGGHIIAMSGSGDPAPMVMSSLDTTTWTWSDAVWTPSLMAGSRGAWADDRLWFLSLDEDRLPRDAVVWDPAMDTWTTVAARCPLFSHHAVALEQLLFSSDDGFAYDTATRTCYRIPARAWPHGIQVWTGTALFAWSGSPGEGVAGEPTGILFEPRRP